MEDRFLKFNTYLTANDEGEKVKKFQDMKDKESIYSLQLYF